MDNKTLEALLAELHSETAKALVKRIKSGDAAPGDFMAAIRFLKENGFDAIPKEGSPTADLAKMVPFPNAADPGFDYPH